MHILVIRCTATVTPWDKIKKGITTKLMGCAWVNFFNYWFRRGHLNRSVDIRYSIAVFNMSLLTVKLKLGLPCRDVWINWSSARDKIHSLILVILLKRVCIGVWKLWKWRIKMRYCFSIITTVTYWI